jgi:hypothetical protein
MNPGILRTAGRGHAAYQPFANIPTDTRVCYNAQLLVGEPSSVALSLLASFRRTEGDGSLRN